MQAPAEKHESGDKTSVSLDRKWMHSPFTEPGQWSLSFNVGGGIGIRLWNDR